MDESDSVSFKYGLEKSGMITKYMVKMVHYGVLTVVAWLRELPNQKRLWRMWLAPRTTRACGTINPKQVHNALLVSRRPITMIIFDLGKDCFPHILHDFNFNVVKLANLILEDSPVPFLPNRPHDEAGA